MVVMKINAPKNSDKYTWTNHVVGKMHYYGLSEQRIKRVVRAPKRIEEGVAPNTVAVMQTQGKGNKDKKWSQEIWVMWQNVKDKKSKTKSQKIRIISAWRYPGVSPERGPIPIPEDILEELTKNPSTF